MPAAPQVTSLTAVQRLQSLGLMGLFGAGISFTYQFTGLGLPCPWRALTGTLCPFCGSTRMGADLLRFDMAGAWEANPFVFSLGVLVSLAAVAWTIEAVGGPALRLPPRLRDQRPWYLALGLAAVAFAVVRNAWVP